MADKINPEVAKYLEKALRDTPDINKEIAGELITKALRERGGLGQFAEFVEAQKASLNAMGTISQEYKRPNQGIDFVYSPDGTVKKVSRGNDDITAAVKRTHGDELAAIAKGNNLEKQFDQSVVKDFTSKDEQLLRDINAAVNSLPFSKAADSIIKSIKNERNMGMGEQKSGNEYAGMLNSSVTLVESSDPGKLLASMKDGATPAAANGKGGPQANTPTV